MKTKRHINPFYNLRFPSLYPWFPGHYSDSALFQDTKEMINQPHASANKIIGKSPAKTPLPLFLRSLFSNPIMPVISTYYSHKSQKYTLHETSTKHNITNSFDRIDILLQMQKRVAFQQTQSIMSL